ncbi:MAG: threonine synthase, partial [Thermoprotei archaeon]
PRLGHYVTLGEGGTPLVRFSSGVYLKLEYMNPTGSFKDRGAALAISRALDLGCGVVVEDSSGNAGIAIAAYAGRAGVKARIYVPSDIPRGKHAILKMLGADVVRAGTRDEAHEAAIRDRGGCYVGHVVNPFFIEGVKDLALELVNELGGPPKAFLAPTASGTLILGVWKGFKELKELGVIDELPRLIAVQACGYSTLKGYVNHYELGCDRPSRIADALRLTKVARLAQIVGAIKETRGFLVVVGDEPALNALKELWRAGVAAEPSSALAYAAATHLIANNLIDKPVVVPITGSGLKYVDMLADLI